MQYSSTSEAKEHTGQFQNIYILQFMYLISINQRAQSYTYLPPDGPLQHLITKAEVLRCKC